MDAGNPVFVEQTVDRFGAGAFLYVLDLRQKKEKMKLELGKIKDKKILLVKKNTPNLLQREFQR